MGEWMTNSLTFFLLLISLPLISPSVYNLVFDEVETIGGGNYSRHEILTNGSFRIIAVPIEGDIDMYISYSTKNVSFELSEHNASSATCGMDYLDIPSVSSFYPRPTYLAIYGHPFHEVSKYRLIVVKRVNEEDKKEEDEYEWEDSPNELIKMIDEGRGAKSHSPLFILFSDHLWNILEIIFTILLEI
ncbi:hypothetical protein PMAYCL1PPCAC_07002 [Pristionchus mayeri]|uniref:Uncharacterized protein n=1 Tax=Pristionchus mayeri TaxID=1317129 RepID=A0AAN4ZFD9_9BILA|nr:hypothetical protein PMAYCL1PPCAC_07002 [Pristionchus mayeri]